MKKMISLALAMSFFISCTTLDSVVKEDSGTFRGKWYNYYDRGVVFSRETDWANAEQSLQKTISMRQKDQRMARTYGMHFIDYFPHRELGIVYLNKGEINDAIRELEESISHEESAKAVYYLNKARQAQLLKLETRPASPEIKIHSPAAAAINGFTLKVKGEVTGQGYISKILINDIPYRVDLARQAIEFEKVVPVNDDTKSITVVSEDLLGAVSVKTIAIKVDREGPAINIFAIASEEAGRKEVVRVTGEVNDGTGIRTLFLNGRQVEVNDARAYEFNTVIDRKAASLPLVIKTLDSLGNETTAELDIEKELIAFNARPEPVLLALSADDLFSFDKKPPVINLKDGEDVPAVFIDKYFVEGEVFDDKQVEEIKINGKDVETKRGRKIFFSKVVGLNDGANNISVDAYDSAGNKSKAAFSVKRNIPSALQVGSRMRMSVLPFESKDQGSALDVLAYEHLIGDFVEQKRFSIIERTKLEQVLMEQKLTREKLTDPKNSIQVGRLMTADAILVASFNETGNSIEFIARVINTETSEVMEVKDVYSEDKSAASVKLLMNGLASKVAGSFPLIEGTIIKKDDKYIYTDIGARMRVKKDMGIIAYRKGEEIRHPLTGKSLGWDTKKLGEGRIEEIQEDFSKAALSDKAGAKDIRVMDMVITK
ncbi:MAG: hypothetical protein HZC49_02800 [Nitrospirae bacterium]|nr:hypothetical protein [Nitrospirota bacterium]